MSRFVRGAWRYVTHDLREHILPSSLPDPPGSPAALQAAVWAQMSRGERVAELRRRWAHHRAALRGASRQYIESWRREFAEPGGEERRGPAGDADASAPRPPGLAAELAATAQAAAARARGTDVRAMLQDLYRTRVGAYRDSVNVFVEGYKEGLESARQGDPFRSVFGDREEPAEASRRPTEGSAAPESGDPEPPAHSAAADEPSRRPQDGPKQP